MMRLLLIVVVLVGLNLGTPLRAEDHQSEPNSAGETHPDSAAPKGSKLHEYISACLAGRPSGGVDVGSISLTPSSSTPNPVQSAVAGSSSGEAVFRNNCLSCHSGASGPPNLTVLNSTSASKAIAQVQSGSMPKGKSLTPQEKSELIKFLESKSKS